MRNELAGGQREPFSMRRCITQFSAALLVVFCVNGEGIAGDWTITPTLAVKGIYSDNIALAPRDREEQQVVTQLNPGIAIDRKARRVQLHTDYGLEYLQYWLHDAPARVNHQLRGSATSELVRDTVFLDGHAGITQQLVSADAAGAGDNISLGQNRTDVVTYGISPSFRRSGALATTELSYAHDVVDYENEAVSDSELHSWRARVANGRRAARLLWNFGYERHETLRETGNDSRRDSANGSVAWRLSREWSVLARGGYEDNNLATSRQFRDGSYWGAGALWTPSQRLIAGVVAGANVREAHLVWRPTRRTQLDAMYRDLEIGPLSGVSWTGSLSHRTRHSVWSASYTKELMNVQRLAVPSPSLAPTPETEPPAPPAPEVPSGSFTLIDEEFLRKRAQVGVGLRGARSSAQLTVFRETREFQLTLSEESSRGVTGAWTWKLGNRTQTVLASSWQETEAVLSGNEYDLWYWSAALDRALSPKTSAGIELRRTLREADDASREYLENRVTARLNMTF